MATLTATFTFVHYTALAVAFLVGYVIGLICGWFERERHDAEGDD